MEAEPSGRTELERNRPLEIREEELDMDKVSKMEVDCDCMCCVWIGWLYLEVGMAEETEEAGEVGVCCLVCTHPCG